MHLAALFQSRRSVPAFMNDSRCRTNIDRFWLLPAPLIRSRSGLFLAQDRAVTFAPHEDTRLRVTEGRLWITFEAPRNGLAPRNGDHFVAAGDRFDLLSGESAVLEPVGSGPGAFFDLEPAASLPWRAVGQQLLARLRRNDANG